MLLYLAACAIPSAILFVLGGDGGLIIAASILSYIFVVFITIIPFINVLLKRLHHYEASEDPESLEQLKSQLQDVNSIDVPVIVNESDGKLVATWRYADDKWFTLMEKKSVTKQYEIHMKFRPETHEVLLIDKLTTLTQSSGVSSSGIFSFAKRFSFFMGVIHIYERRLSYGLREDFTPGKVQDYEFQPTELKTPVVNTILTHGWDVRYGYW